MRIRPVDDAVTPLVIHLPLWRWRAARIRCSAFYRYGLVPVWSLRALHEPPPIRLDFVPVREIADRFEWSPPAPPPYPLIDRHWPSDEPPPPPPAPPITIIEAAARPPTLRTGGAFDIYI